MKSAAESPVPFNTRKASLNEFNEFDLPLLSTVSK
jgi:hypothetical protein